jgi:2-oxo-4-hydroxy-4-carboxy-5-ureidoimidazoline decarboxylase
MELWRRIDDAPAAQARALLTTCCGSTRWVERMAGRRPFGSREELLIAARQEWFTLSEGDWLEAFRQHPRIGDRDALRARFAGTAHLSEKEQAGVEGAAESVLAALADANRAYEKKFGHIFIVCATGLRAEEMLARLHARLPNDPATEIRIAAEEQAMITAIRLAAR